MTNAKLETKLKQLRITVDRTYSIFETKHQEAVERHISAIKSVTESINGVRVTVEEEKIQTEVDRGIMALTANWQKET